MSAFDCKLCIGTEHLTIITVLATTISITISYMLIFVFYFIVLFVFLVISNTPYVIVCDFHTI